MADTHHAQGPGKSVLGIGQRIVSIMVEMVETRLRLAVVELEEEKANLFQLLLMLGLTMLFAAFGLMSLMAIWTIRHPNMLVRWARRGFGVWSAWRLVKTTLKQQQLRG